jgi:PPOX class probable F420-dependent enzyme
MPVAHPLDLAAVSFVSLETYRKDGGAVRVPVWCGEHEGKLWIWTSGASLKVERLRHNPLARIAQCSATGKRVLSDWLDVRVTIHDDARGVASARAALERKYGLQMWLIENTLWLRGKDRHAFVGLEVTTR